MTPTRWRFLRPWFRALAPWLEYRAWPDIEKRTLRSRLRALRVYLSKPEEIEETKRQTSARLVVLREAIELVGLALHYDHNAWEEFERLDDTMKPAEYKHWRQYGDASDLEPRFELAFDVAHEDQLFETWWRVNEADVFAWDMHLCARLLRLEPQDLSVEYHAAKAQLVARVATVFDPQYRIELQFTFMPPRQPTTSYVGQLQKLIQSIRTPSSAARGGFTLTLMHAYLHSLPYTAELASFFEFVRRSDIQLAMASIGACNGTTDDETSVNRMVDATMVASNASEIPQREARMMVVHKSDSWLFAKICARLTQGSRIDHLVLEDAFTGTGDDQERHAKWELLGRALRDPKCGRPLKLLSLAAMENITEADITAFKNGSWSSHITFCRQVIMAKHSMVRLSSGALVPVDSLESYYRSFDVVEDSGTEGEWMPIHVLENGTCYVKCADVVDAFDCTTVNIPPSTLESLDVGCTRCDADNIVGLTKCFSDSLRHLNIHVWYDPKMRPDTLASVFREFRECPHLVALSLTNVTVRNLRVFLKAYAAAKNPCRLTQLSLTNTQADDASILAFVYALCDSTHPMTRILREFRYVDAKLRDLGINSNRPSPKAVHALLAMLEQNKTLEFLEIGLVPGLYQTYEAKFRAFHNEPLEGARRREISLVEITEVE